MVNVYPGARHACAYGYSAGPPVLGQQHGPQWLRDLYLQLAE